MTAGFSQPLKTLFAGLAGDPKLDTGSEPTDPGNEVEVIRKTIDVGKKRELTQIFLSSNVSGKMEVFHGTDSIATGRTNPGHPGVFFSWLPSRPIAAGETVSVKFTALANTPVATVEAFLQSVENPV
jgi:hypothetical protein